MRAVWWMCLVGCTTEPKASFPAPDLSPWERPDERLTVPADLASRWPWLTDLSRFADHLEGPPEARPDPSHRGAYGVGNGTTFGLLGLTDPLNTLHGVVGPRYAKSGRFWGDTALTVEVDGADAPSTEAWIARVRDVDAVVTTEVFGPVTLTVIDLAPRADDARPVLLRVVHAESTAAVDVDLRVDAFDAPIALGDLIAAPDGDRQLGYVSLGDPLQLTDALRLPLGAVAPGAPVTSALVLVPADDEAGLRATVARLPDLDTLVADHTAASAPTGMRVDTTDAWLADWLDGLAWMIRVQTDADGSVQPMSRYTGTWLRDTIGPVRFWARYGQPERAAAALATLERCHAARGDIGNSCSPGTVISTPEWDDLPPFSGRTAAEGPSHLPLMADEVARWTGDTLFIDQHWAYLRRSVLAQTLTDDGLQPWSGDETFRLVMNVALGWPLEVPWQDTSWSSNSSYLMLAATDALSRHAVRRADGEEAVFDTLHDRALAGLDAFRQPDGHHAALLLRDPAEPPETAPFEDAALSAIAFGGLPPDSEDALANLAGLLAVAGRGDGTVQSPPDDLYAYAGSPLASGALTGMLPGYVLDNFTLTGHPEADLAFDQLLAYASPSGQYDEGQLYADKAAFSPLYDVGGSVGDVSARFRPWEGGLVGAAALQYLLGQGPVDTAETEAGWQLRLAPRAPGGDFGVRDLPVRGALVDVSRRWEDGAWEVTVAARGAEVPVLLEVPLGVWEDVEVAATGPEGPGGVVVRPLGERVVRFPPLVMSAGQTAMFRVGPR